MKTDTVSSENTELTETVSNIIREKECYTSSFSNTLRMYMKEKHIKASQLVILSGINKNQIYKIIDSRKEISYDYLCAICIALRLEPEKQENLFSLAHYAFPDSTERSSIRDTIIRAFLDRCAFVKDYSIDNCNKILILYKEKPLTSLSFGKGERV